MARQSRISTMIRMEVVLLIGNALIIWNIGLWRNPCEYQLVQKGNTSMGRKPVVWFYPWNNKYIHNSFERMGYTVVYGLDGPEEWDVLCAYRLPFTDKKLHDITSRSRILFKLNHVFKIGVITHKAYFITKTVGPAKKYMPMGYAIPNEYEQFRIEVQKNPDKLWVVKNFSHRGTKIVSANDLDLENRTKRFFEEFVSNPYLVDNRKFSIGVFVIITSIDPLRVYVYDDVLLKFCAKDYYPFDLTDQDRHMTSQHSAARFWQLESLKKFGNESVNKYSHRRMLERHIEETTGDNGQIFYDQVYDAVARVFYSYWEDFQAPVRHNHQMNSHCFEVMRCDFMMDDDTNLVLIECNMSPSMARDKSNPSIVNIWDQVYHSSNNVLGVPQNYIKDVSKRWSYQHEVRVKDSDIQVYQDSCYSSACMECEQGCELCLQCLSAEHKEMLKMAFHEHLNRGNIRKVIPFPESSAEVFESGLHGFKPSFSDKDILLQKWFKMKCAEDKYWCQ